MNEPDPIDLPLLCAVLAVNDQIAIEIVRAHSVESWVERMRPYDSNLRDCSKQWHESLLRLQARLAKVVTEEAETAA